MQQTQLRAIQQEQDSGVQNRQRVDNTLGALVHAPGSNGGRSMAVEAINSRVASQGGHVIARARQTGVINQNVAPQLPARLPAVIAPEIVMNNVQRGQRLDDDPFIAAVLRLGESAGASAPTAPPASNFKVQHEARGIELQNLMLQHKFISSLSDDQYPNRADVLKDLADRIVGTNDVATACPICQENFANAGLTFIATLPCCNQRIHTNCLLQLSQQAQKKCPMCRTNLCLYM